MIRRAGRWAVGAAIGLALAVSAAACGTDALNGADVEVASLAFTMKDINGQDVNLADFKGKPLVVNFWAVWCGPCKIETPMLVTLYEKYKDKGLTIVGIETESSVDKVRAFATEYKVTYPMLIGLDRGDVQSAFKWTGSLPTTVFVRADGTVAARARGLQTDAYWEKTILGLF